jgi:hypothetical protein
MARRQRQHAAVRGPAGEAARCWGGQEARTRRLLTAQARMWAR